MPHASSDSYKTHLASLHQQLQDSPIARAYLSAVSCFSWNLVIEPGIAKGRYRPHSQAPFILDTRLHPSRP